MGRPLLVRGVSASQRTIGHLVVRCVLSLAEGKKGSPAVSESTWKSMTASFLSFPYPQSPGNLPVSCPSCFHFS